MTANKTRQTLILTQQQIQKVADLKKVIQAVETAFKEYALGRAQMPSKIYLDIRRYNGDFRAMPAYIERSQSCCLKWVNTHPDNYKRALPLVMAVVIVSDPKTGFPLCIMDGTYLTALRTGAAGAVAAKHLVTHHSPTVALIGCGVQAMMQLRMLRCVFTIKRVHVWGHQKLLVDQFVKTMKRRSEIMEKSNNISDCVKEADLIVTTTPSRKPLVEASWIKKGTHINAIGADAPGKQELDPKILKQGTVVIDDWPQAMHGGEINVPFSQGLLTKRDIYATLGEILIGKKKKPVHPKTITIFDSTGLAIQDAAIAHLLYQSALKQNLGRKIRLF